MMWAEMHRILGVELSGRGFVELDWDSGRIAMLRTYVSPAESAHHPPGYPRRPETGPHG